jgi:hypothetical protein
MLLEGLSKTNRNSRVAGVRVEIRTENFPGVAATPSPLIVCWTLLQCLSYVLGAVVSVEVFILVVLRIYDVSSHGHVASHCAGASTHFYK